MTLDEDAPPPEPNRPPWPENFLADLHAGCYDRDDNAVDPRNDPVAALWATVQADPDAAACLSDLDRVQTVVMRLGADRRR